MSYKNIRREYSLSSLSRDELNDNPLSQLKKWFNEAIDSKHVDANAMHLSTVDENQMPDGRVVLCKGIDEIGVIFYTNYKSNKAKQLSLNPACAITFYWQELQRQIRLKGKVVKLTAEENQEYFCSRPIESQAAAIASPQSQVIDSRDELEELYNKLMAQVTSNNKEKKFNCPDSWGGYRVIPDYFEFFQGGKHRMHDRFRYQLMSNKKWKINRLAP